MNRISLCNCYRGVVVLIVLFLLNLTACGKSSSSGTSTGTGNTYGSEIILLNQTSNAGVDNNPPTKSTFTLSGTTRITKILTYHWNSGNGDTPGTFSLKNTVSGTVYGPWTAIGNKTGVDNTLGATWPATASGPPYLYWIAQPNTDLPAGTYELVDSKPATWSYTSDTGNKGISLVYGKTLGSTPPTTASTISKLYTQGDMTGKPEYHASISQSVGKTSGALLQAILSINSFLYTDFSSTTIETVRSRQLEANKALDTLIKYAAETEKIIDAGMPKQAALAALSPEDVLATVSSGPSNRQIKTLMNTYGVNAKKAQVILRTAMAGLESSAWKDEAALNNTTANALTAIKETAGLTLTIAGTVATAGGVSGALTIGQAASAIITGADGIIKVTKAGLELATGKEVTIPDGSKASLVITTLSTVSDIIAFKDMGKLVSESLKTGDNVGNIITLSSKITDAFVDRTITFSGTKVDISNGLSIGSSVDVGYINGMIGGLIDAPSTEPGTYKINGVKKVVTTLPDSMTKAINVLPVSDKVDTTKISGIGTTTTSTTTTTATTSTISSSTTSSSTTTTTTIPIASPVTGTWHSNDSSDWTFNNGSGLYRHSGWAAGNEEPFTYIMKGDTINLSGAFFSGGAYCPSYKVTTISESSMNWQNTTSCSSLIIKFTKQ